MESHKSDIHICIAQELVGPNCDLEQVMHLALHLSEMENAKELALKDALKDAEKELVLMIMDVGVNIIFITFISIYLCF